MIVILFSDTAAASRDVEAAGKDDVAQLKERLARWLLLVFVAAAADVLFVLCFLYLIFHFVMFFNASFSDFFIKRLEENEKLMSQQLKQQQQQHRRSPSLEPPPRLLSPIIESNSPPHANPARAPVFAAAAPPPPLPEVSSPPRLDRSDAFHVHLLLCSHALTSTLEHLYFLFTVVHVHNLIANACLFPL